MDLRDLDEEDLVFLWIFFLDLVFRLRSRLESEEVDDEEDDDDDEDDDDESESELEDDELVDLYGKNSFQLIIYTFETIINSYTLRFRDLVFFVFFRLADEFFLRSAFEAAILDFSLSSNSVLRNSVKGVR